MPIIKCEVCNSNRLDCERKQYGYRLKFYMVCKSCQEEMKLTGKIISSTAKHLVATKPDKFALFTKLGKIFGVTPIEST